MTKKQFFLVFFAILLTAVSFCGCAKETEKENEDVTVTVEEDVPADDADTYLIETPFADLAYPIRWKDTVKVEKSGGEVYCAAFFSVLSSGEEVHIFDISFSGDEAADLGDFIGVVSKDAKRYNVYFNGYAPDTAGRSEEDAYILQGMYGDASYVIESISAAISFLEDTSFEISTPYATLNYPKEWENITKVKTEKNPYTVVFYGATASGDVRVFDLIFDGDEGDLLGYILHDGSTISLRLVTYDVDENTALREQEKYDLAGMKTDVNFIIASLAASGIFEYPE